VTWKDLTQEELDDALYWAAGTDNIGKVKKILRSGARMEWESDDGSRALHLAAGRGMISSVKYLVGGGALTDVGDKKGMRPLHLAALWDHKDVVKFLLGAGADPEVLNGTGQKPRDLCANMEIRRMLEAEELKCRASRDAERREAMAEHILRQKRLGSLRPKGPSL